MYIFIFIYVYIIKYTINFVKLFKVKPFTFIHSNILAIVFSYKHSYYQIFFYFLSYP